MFWFLQPIQRFSFVFVLQRYFALFSPSMPSVLSMDAGSYCVTENIPCILRNCAPYWDSVVMHAEASVVQVSAEHTAGSELPNFETKCFVIEAALS